MRKERDGSVEIQWRDIDPGQLDELGKEEIIGVVPCRKKDGLYRAGARIRDL